MRRSRNLGVSLLLLLICWGSVPACGDRGADPESPERRLLDQAISAAFGESDPTAPRTYRQVTRWEGSDAERPGPVTEVEVLVGRDERYRESRRHPYGITEVFATNGETAWASVDGTVVPLSEQDLAQRSLQPWLIEVSRLAPLRDADRFRLEHGGRETIENIGEVESLTVTSDEQPGLEITLQFDVTTHRVRRVALNARGRDFERSLVLDDYRAVDGVQIAHRILAYRDDELLKRQIVREAAFDAAANESVFEKPLDLNRDAIVDKPQGLSGALVSMRHEGDEEDVFDTVETLRNWIEEAELVTAGPLTIQSEEATGGTTVLRVAIVIETPGAEATAAATADEAVTIETRDASRVLSLTHVGEVVRAELVTRLEARAQELGLTPAGTPIELFFSTDGRLRQVQLPVR